MGSRVAEIDQHAVAHVFRNETIEPGDDPRDGAVIGGDDLAQIFRIEARGEFGRPDQIAKHHRQLPALSLGRCRCIAGCCRHRSGGSIGRYYT